MNRQSQIDHFLLMSHQLAVARLKANPERVEQVRAQLDRWRHRSGPTRSDPYWDKWETLLQSNVDDLETVVCATSEESTALRNVSPMSVLITQSERAQLLRAARQT